MTDKATKTRQAAKACMPQPCGGVNSATRHLQNIGGASIASASCIALAHDIEGFETLQGRTALSSRHILIFFSPVLFVFTSIVKLCMLTVVSHS
jgi:hypothetical protein